MRPTNIGRGSSRDESGFNTTDQKDGDALEALGSYRRAWCRTRFVSDSVHYPAIIEMINALNSSLRKPPNLASARNRRPGFPLGGFDAFERSFCAQPLVQATVGDSQR